MLIELSVNNAKPKEKTYMVRDEIQTARAKGESPSRKSSETPQTFSEAAD